MISTDHQGIAVDLATHQFTAEEVRNNRRIRTLAWAAARGHNNQSAVAALNSLGMSFRKDHG